MAKTAPTATSQKSLDNLARIATKLAKKRAEEKEIWIEAKAAIKEAYAAGGITYDDVAKAFGFTRARVYQVVTGNRGGKKASAGISV